MRATPAPHDTVDRSRGYCQLCKAPFPEPHFRAHQRNTHSAHTARVMRFLATHPGDSEEKEKGT